jgi:hypothetical protein
MKAAKYFEKNGYIYGVSEKKEISIRRNGKC